MLKSTQCAELTKAGGLYAEVENKTLTFERRLTFLRRLLNNQLHFCYFSTLEVDL